MKRVDVASGDVTISCLVGGPSAGTSSEASGGASAATGGETSGGASAATGGETSGAASGGASGATVVLLHGLAGSANEWRGIAEALADRHRVIAVDLRGHGYSTLDPQDVSREAYADDVAKVIAELAGGGPVALIGQSMGGHTALLVAAWHPALVARLVLVESGVGGGDDQDYPDELGDFFASWPVPFADAAEAHAFLGDSVVAKAWLADLEETPEGLWPRFDAEVMRESIAEVAAVARWEEWRSVRAATLVVRGEKGLVGDEEFDRMLALRPGTREVTIAGAGHDVHLDDPESLLREVREFLA